MLHLSILGLGDQPRRMHPTHHAHRSLVHFLALKLFLRHEKSPPSSCALASAKPLGDVARMRAVFSAAVAVNLEDSAAMPAHQWIDGFPLHKMKMAVPPLLTTGIRTEPPLFPAGNLLHRLAAAFATQANIRSLRLDCLRLCCIHPAAKRLHGVLG